VGAEGSALDLDVGAAHGQVRGAMKLMTAHKILISAAIAFFLFYALLQLLSYFHTGGASALVRGVLSIAVAVGFGIYIYFRSLRPL
jgi:hypothetical protein